MAASIRRFSIALALLQVPALAWSWGGVGHDLANRAAANMLPPEMPAFFLEATERLADLASEPDRWRSEDYGVLKRGTTPDHFVDFEYVADILDPEHAPLDRYAFLQLLIDKDVAKRNEVELFNVGFGPYRAAELAERLELEFCRRALLRDPGLMPKEAGAAEKALGVEQSILWTAGTLGHYVADLANPHHATKHYNGWTGPNPRGYATDRETHRRFESDFVGRSATELGIVLLVPLRPKLRSNYLVEIWRHAQSANALAVDLYEVDCTGAFLPGAEASEVGLRGLRFAHERLAAGAALLRDLWFSAWRRGEERAARLRAAPRR